jgi:hypothetical protein
MTFSLPALAALAPFVALVLVGAFCGVEIYFIERQSETK